MYREIVLELQELGFEVDVIEKQASDPVLIIKRPLDHTRKVRIIGTHVGGSSPLYNPGDQVQGVKAFYTPAHDHPSGHHWLATEDE